MNRAILRQVLDCGSPLPLSSCWADFPKRQRAAAVQDCPRRWRDESTALRFMVPMRGQKNVMNLR